MRWLHGFFVAPWSTTSQEKIIHLYECRVSFWQFSIGSWEWTWRGYLQLRFQTLLSVTCNYPCLMSVPILFVHRRNLYSNRNWQAAKKIKHSLKTLRKQAKKKDPQPPQICHLLSMKATFRFKGHRNSSSWKRKKAFVPPFARLFTLSCAWHVFHKDTYGTLSCVDFVIFIAELFTTVHVVLPKTLLVCYIKNLPDLDEHGNIFSFLTKRWLRFV